MSINDISKRLSRLESIVTEGSAELTMPDGSTVPAQRDDLLGCLVELLGLAASETLGVPLPESCAYAHLWPAIMNGRPGTGSEQMISMMRDCLREIPKEFKAKAGGGVKWQT